MPNFPTCKITVLKRMYNPEIAETYRRPDVRKGKCDFFSKGQEFIVEYLAQQPEGFKCEWAWHDIHKVLLTLMLRGSFGTWMKDENMFITCCTDGVKPVIFKIERLEDE